MLTTWFVDADAVHAGDGAAWSAAFNDLQGALTAAAHGDEIWIAEGVYHPTQTVDRSASFVIPDGVSLFGGFAGGEALRDSRDPLANFSILSGYIGNQSIDTDDSYHVVTVPQGHEAILDSLHIRGGFANGDDVADRRGAGVANYGSLQLENVSIGGSWATGYGGGVYNAAHLEVASSTLFGNDARGRSFDDADPGSGGGIAAGRGSSTVVRDVSITEGFAVYGGGIYVLSSIDEPSMLSVTNSVIGTGAQVAGGAIVAEAGASVTVSHSTLIGSAPEAQQVSVESPIVLHNSLFGAYLLPWEARGVAIRGPIDSASSFNLIAAADGTTLSMNGVNGNIVGTLAAPIDDGVSTESVWISSTNLRHQGVRILRLAVSSDSPAVDGGDPSFDPASFGPPLTTDFVDRPRVRDDDGDGSARIDIGAIEANVLRLVVSTTVDENDGDYSEADLSLREAVMLANENEGDELIELPAGVYEFSIDDDVTDPFEANATHGDLALLDPLGTVHIVGAGAETTIIDANGLDRAFNVAYGGLRLTGVTVRGGDATTQWIDEDGVSHESGVGGGVYVRGRLVLEDSVIEENHSPDVGGGLFVDEDGFLEATRTIIRNNTSTDGGGAWSDESADVTITDSLIEGNVVSGSGGGWHARETHLKLFSTIVRNNTAGESGGGLTGTGSSLELTATDVFDNVAGQLGGGVYLQGGSGADLVASTITENRVGNGGYGGGIYVVGSYLTLSESDVVGNKAGETIGYGGGIASDSVPAPFRSSTIVIDESTIEGNTAATRGGGLNVGEYVVVAITGTQIRDNEAQSGGGLYSTTLSLAIEDSPIEANHATFGSGGGLYIADGALTLTESTVIANTARSGGGLFVDDAVVTIRESRFERNVAELTGGAVHNEEATVTIIDTEFESNTASTLGGAIYSSETELDIVASGIRKNTAGSDGGGIYVIHEQPFTMRNSTVANNRAGEGGLGGGLYLEKSVARIEGGLMNNNTAGVAAGSGGAIYITNELSTDPELVVTIEGVTLANNSAADNGGGIALGENTRAIVQAGFLRNAAGDHGGGLYSEAISLEVEDSRFTENDGGNQGGGLFVAQGAGVSVARTEFLGNKAGTGAGVYLDDVGDVQMNVGLFKDNVAQLRGGGIYMRGHTALAVDAVTFLENVAGTAGGAVHVSEGTSLRAADVRFELNETQGNGGAVSTVDRTELYFDHVQFIDNRAGVFGGAVEIDEGISTFDEVELRGNWAGQQGGAVYIADDEQVATFIDSAIVENRVGENGQGGGLYVYRGTISLNYVTVTGNSTGTGGTGGGLYLEGLPIDENTSTIAGSTIVNNSAESGGGITVAGGIGLSISDTSINGNSATVAGGGLLTANLTTDIEDSPMIALQNVDFIGNMAAFGAGLYNGNNQMLALTNSLIADNTAAQEGAGAINDGGHLRLENTIVRGNRIDFDSTEENAARIGAGLLNQALAADATMVLLGSSVIENVIEISGVLTMSASGAGIANISRLTGPGTTEHRADLLIEESVVSRNVLDVTTVHADLRFESRALASGAGIFSSGLGSVSLVESTVDGNLSKARATPGDYNDDVQVQAVAGGILLDDSRLTVIASTISRNVADADNAADEDSARAEGGGVSTISGLEPIVFVNSTISGNRTTARSFGGFAQAQGGGVHAGSAESPQFILSTIARNEIAADGMEEAAVGAAIVSPSSSPVRLYGSIVAENIGPEGTDVSGPVVSLGHNLIGSATLPTGNATDLVGSPAAPIDARLEVLTYKGGFTETHALLDGSPAIDAGDPAFDPNDFSPQLSTDQRGEPRVLDGNGDGTPRVDIGSFEYTPITYMFADLNGDGIVGVRDLVALQRGFGTSDATYAQGDLTGDGIVDRADVGVLVSHFGRVLPPIASPSAPAAVVRAVTRRAGPGADVGLAADPVLADVRAAIRAARRRDLTAESVDLVHTALVEAGENLNVPRIRVRRR